MSAIGRRTAFAALALIAALALAGCVGPIPRDEPAAPAPSVQASLPATPAAPATVAVEPTATAEATPSVEIGWVGDTLVGSRYGLAPDGGRALFTGVVEDLRAPDVTAGNLEGTLSTARASKCDSATSKTCYAFKAPPAYAAALAWAGFDVMSLANNHAHDYLDLGLAQTRATLDANGLAYTGLPGQVAVREAKGIRVAFVAFSPYPWNADIGDVPRAQALVRAAARKADVVIVLMHAGAEGAGRTHTPAGAERAFGEFRGDPRAFAHAMVDAGADAVLGSGPHVIRGIERYDGKPIAYSLGNFASWGGLGKGGVLSLSGLLTLRIAKDGTFLGGRWLSLKLVGRGVPAIDESNESASLVRALSLSDFTDTFPISDTGTIEP